MSGKLNIKLQIIGLILSYLKTCRSVNYGVYYEVPDPPFNLTIEELHSTSATLTWNIDEKFTHFILELELTIHSILEGEESQSEFSETTTEQLDGLDRSIDLGGLSPATQYQVYIVAISNQEKRSNKSEILTFKTLPDISETRKKLMVHPGEVTIVALILIAWICAIALFLQKWGRIRIVQNQEPRFKREFKNLDTIKVVKRPTDSVIYRSYPRQFTRTMLAREKRMERMNTMPNIKIPETEEERTKDDSYVIDLNDHKKMVQRFKTLATLPVIETEEEVDSVENNTYRKRTESKNRPNIDKKINEQPVIELDELKTDENQSEL